ncbi:hypothetical protein [Vreelandella maris]|uniref:hypothetical protein n=1 Tax=Vreelandella maris TaxID=2729617 RepID=UPI0030EC2523|tara:strand:- start:1043 stop:1537 length:495 start_codon:yes stop_codon:yes gene_type:complete
MAMDQLYTDTLKELERANARIAALEDDIEIFKAAEEMQIALREKMELQRDELATDRADLIKELTACQNMLHGLAYSGGCSPDYPNDAKKVLGRVTGGHAPDFEDSGPNGKSLSRRDALNQVEALEKLAHELASDLPEKCARKQILAAFRLRIGSLRRQAKRSES